MYHPLMRLVTRGALVRIGIGLVAIVIAGFYMVRCPGRGRRLIEARMIPVENLRTHVEMLAARIGEHNFLFPERLEKVAGYIENVWREQGYQVARCPYQAHGMTCSNLEATRRGKTKPGEIVLVGAHYDSVEGSPGANDNATGVAALLELSRYFATVDPQRTVRFVAFVNEEPPFFETELQGARVYAKAARERNDNIRVMVCLETMGYYSEAPGTQRFPSPLFKLFYPSRGNFIGFVSNLKSRTITRRAVSSFRAHTDFPVECCSTFANLAGVNLSDHAAFWREGYPAFMVTDTALFRYPYYHTEQDTPDKVHYEALGRVTQGLCGTIATLAAE